MGKMNTPKPMRSVYSIYIKRLLDIILSGLALLVLSPVLAVVSVLELFIHGRPAIYKTHRPGKDGKIFTLYKFRSMTNERDCEGKLLPESKRLTRFGRFLRKSAIDELPELVNILKGDMSIVGPRPLLIEYLDMYSSRHAIRQSVRSGLACVRIQPTQSKTWTWREQFENDIYYIQNISLRMDMKMVFGIVKEAIKGSDYRVDDTRVPFIGSNLDEIRSRDEANIDISFKSLS